MGKVLFADSTAGVEANGLRGFFAGWPAPPSPETCLDMLDGSDHMVLALDEESGAVVGFVTAISDGVLSAFVSSLQVLPAYWGRGIGSELARRMLKKLDGYYVVSLTCDPKLQPFYERVGMRPSGGMVLLNRERRSRPAV